MTNVHCQKNMVCLTTTEFDRVIKQLESVENERDSLLQQMSTLNECGLEMDLETEQLKKRITLLEETLRNTEIELAREKAANLSMQLAMEKACTTLDKVNETMKSK